MRIEASNGARLRRAAPLLAVLILFAGRAFGQDIPKIAREDKIRIKEAFHLLHEIGDEVWPGWSRVRMPVVFVDKDFEYLIGHPNPGKDFILIENDAYLETTIHGKKRTTMPNIAAAFPVGENPLPAVLIGSSANQESDSSSWLLMVIHEMFHVLQQNNGEYEKKVKSLKLGDESNPSWMLNYAFPYEDQSIRALISQMAFALNRSLKSKENRESEVRSYLDLRAIFRDYLRMKFGSDDNYSYCKFQEWIEGSARYAERAVLRKAVERKYRPIPEFEQLKDFVPFETVWARSMAGSDEKTRAALDAIRENFTRLDFYSLGAAQANLLDTMDGSWQERFFSQDLWLDDLVRQGFERWSSPIGKSAPPFEMKSVSGETIRSRDLTGKPVLLFFMSAASWAGPVFAILPAVNQAALDFKSKGLQTLGVLLMSGEKETEDFIKTQALSFPLLIGSDPAYSSTQRADLKPFRMNIVPGFVLIGRDGKIAFHHVGWIKPDILIKELKKIVD